jgi:tripartite-type tricarboxylate transporter receptor subunit TctC
VLVDNRPGGGTAIANNYVRQQPADGHLLYMVASQFTTGPATHPQIHNYNPATDYTPISRLTGILLVLVANAQQPFSTVPELIAYAKANPGKLNVATTGSGSSEHLAGELFQLKSGAKLTFVPYKGGAPAIADVIAGTVQLRFDAMPSSRPHIDSGKLKAIAVAELKRSAMAPNIPTIADAIPGFEVPGYFGLAAPKGLPREVVARLNREAVEIMKMSDIDARMRQLGLEPITTTPEEFASMLTKDYQQWVSLLKQTGIKIE